MKILYDVNDLDFAEMYRFCVSCCLAREEGEIITLTGLTYKVSKTG